MDKLAGRFERAAVAGTAAVLADGASVSFELAGDGWTAGFRVADGAVTPAAAADVDFRLAAKDSIWEGLISDRPAAGAHSIVHLVRTGVVQIQGSQLEYERHLHIVRALLDATREGSRGAGPGRPLSARGSYNRISTSLGTSDIYIERAGAGPPLLAFATAGSDTSQWHGVMTQTDITDRYELITADLPWHGRSSPAWGEPAGSYKLTPRTYTDWIVAVSDALDLEHPVLVGVSMGGAAVVHAVATRPERFAGAVACQAGPSVQARANVHLRGTQVNASLFIPEWTFGLMNPASPDEFKQRVWWGYSSGGFGLYAADIASYLTWDFDTVERLLTPDSPHIAVLSGVFDTSVPPERSRLLADRIPNSSFTVMPELGHFPHAENPAAFVRYLEPALQRVLETPVTDH